MGVFCLTAETSNLRNLIRTCANKKCDVTREKPYFECFRDAVVGRAGEQMTSRLRVACWMSEKKLNKFNWSGFQRVCEESGIETFKVRVEREGGFLMLKGSISAGFVEGFGVAGLF